MIVDKVNEVTYKIQRSPDTPAKNVHADYLWWDCDFRRPSWVVHNPAGNVTSPQLASNTPNLASPSSSLPVADCDAGLRRSSRLNVKPRVDYNKLNG